MREITATAAARGFSDLLDAVEHKGEEFEVTRHGRVVAVIKPQRRKTVRELDAFFAQHTPIPGFGEAIEEALSYVVDDIDARIGQWLESSSTPRS